MFAECLDIIHRGTQDHTIFFKAMYMSVLSLGVCWKNTLLKPLHSTASCQITKWTRQSSGQGSQAQGSEMFFIRPDKLPWVSGWRTSKKQMLLCLFCADVNSISGSIEGMCSCIFGQWLIRNLPKPSSGDMVSNPICPERVCPRDIPRNSKFYTRRIEHQHLISLQ